MGYEFDLDTNAFAAGLQAALKRIEAGTRREEERLADSVISLARPPVLTGTLAASGYSVGARFGWAAPYAVYVEYGTEDTPTFAFARQAERLAAQLARSPL